MRYLIIFVALIGSVNAANLGVLGQTYEIKEQNFLEYIEQKLKGMQANGEWQKLEVQFKKKVEAQIERPAPIALPRARENKSHLFNPTIEAPYDIHDMNGQLIVSKGTAINPLDKIRLSSVLLFLNADDEEQVKWALEESQKADRVKLILVSGSIKSATETFKQAIYFDLNGFLIKKFHIKALPAQVEQYGNRLRISEVTL
jgi:conjugal transfer pilus assembly protein TraW